MLRTRDSSLWYVGISCGKTDFSFSPSPPDSGDTWRTTASIRIVPSLTRKCSFSESPCAFRIRVSRKSPPALRSRTCETSLWGSASQYTHTSPVAAMREVCLREGEEPIPNIVYRSCDLVWAWMTCSRGGCGNISNRTDSLSISLTQRQPQFPNRENSQFSSVPVSRAVSFPQHFRVAPPSTLPTPSHQTLYTPKVSSSAP